MSEIVYKIARRFEWDAAEKTGIYVGSADDQRDGFIHFSSASQVYTTSSKYFGGESAILLVAVESNLLGPALKWEESRRGEKFPHLYAPLALTSVQSVTEIRRSADGRFMFPPEICNP